MMTLYFGLPRSGKTTMLARYIKKFGYKYNHIYIAGETLVNDSFDPDFITYIHPYELGSFKPVYGSLFILCEAGTYFNNRLWASIPSYCTDFFCLHGHYGCDIIADSQAVDVDLKFRSRCERLYVVSKSRWPFGYFFSNVTEIRHKLGVRPDSQDLADTYHVPESLLQRIVARITFRSIWLFRPFYYNIFDTHSDILFNDDGLLPKPIVLQQIKSATTFKKFNEYARLLENALSKNTTESINEDAQTPSGGAEDHP